MSEDRVQREDRLTRGRVLFIGAGAPWSGGAGYLGRQRQFIDALREIADVRLVMLETEGAAPAPEDWNARVVPFPARSRMGRWRRLFEDLVERRPSALRGWHVEALREAIREEGPESFDAVFAYRIDHAYLAGVLEHPRLLLDVDDPEHLRRRRRYELAAGGRSWRVERDLHLLERFEIEAARTALASFVCQDGDARAFGEPAPIVVPNCVRVPGGACAPDRAGPVLVTLGNFGGSPDSPNVDGLRWFAREVWGYVRERCPQATLEVVGRCSASLRAELDSMEGVEVLGFVESLDEVFERAAMSVAPIRFGTGTRVKILESMARGCPVVTTSAGSDGLEVIGGDDILIADEPGLLADACAHLLESPPMRAEIGQAGRSVVEMRYDVEKQHARLVELLGGIIGRDAARGAAA